MPRLPKDPSLLASEDLTAIIVERWPEDEQLEFKQALPTKNEQGDRWVTHGDTIGDRAKIGVFSEVVAFANSYGGDLVLGIQESDDNPKCAEKRTPIPRCQDLSEQLAMVARNVIEPQIPRLEFRGIPIDDSGDGFVVIRVPQSRLAPHRLTINKECYRRRGGSSEAMTMREIQDLTFSVARGLHAVEMRLMELRQKFESWHQSGHRRLGQSFAYRVSAAPTSSNMFFDPVHDVQAIRPPTSERFALVDGNTRYNMSTKLPQGTLWRPMLRGTQMVQGDPRTSEHWGLIHLSSDGVINYQVAHTALVPATATDQGLDAQAFGLYPGWLFGIVANAVDAVDRVRAHAGAENVDYALEVHIQSEADLPVIRIFDGGGWDVGGVLKQGSHLLPRYVVGGKDSRSLLLNLIWRDFWNQIGIDPKPDGFRLAD